MACVVKSGNFGCRLLRQTLFTTNSYRNALFQDIAQLSLSQQSQRLLCHNSQSVRIESCLHRNADIEKSKSFSTSVAVKYADEDAESDDIVEKVNGKLKSDDIGRLFAVVHISGKQRKITTEDIIIVDKQLEADIGERIVLNKVLLVGGKDFSLVGKPLLSPDLVRVEATVLEKTLDYTKIISWYKRRENFKVMKLRKKRLTMLRINNIEINSSKES